MSFFKALANYCRSSNDHACDEVIKKSERSSSSNSHRTIATCSTCIYYCDHNCSYYLLGNPGGKSSETSKLIRVNDPDSTKCSNYKKWLGY